jgi:putative restriction endonuclease
MVTSDQLEQLQYYSIKFSRLRVDRAHGIAPHKPILVLSVLHLIGIQAIQQNQIYLRDELIETFLQAWRYLGSENHGPDVFRPFFHLRGDRFWHHIPNRGFRKIVTSKIKLKTFGEVKQAIKYACMDDCLFEMLQDPITRESLESVLVQKWFQTKSELYQCLKSEWGR